MNSLPFSYHITGARKFRVKIITQLVSLKYELKIVIEALNVRRLKYKERGIHDLVACDLILYLLDIIEA